MADPRAKFVISAEDRTGRAIASADRNLKTLSRTANSVRSMFGVLGLAISGRAFAGWIGGALKAAEATGEHAEKIKAAQDAMASMKRASDELAVSLGVQLVPAMQAVSAVLIGWNRIVGGADPFPFEKQIESLRAQLKVMDAQWQASKGMPFEWQVQFVQSMAAAEKALDDLLNKQREALGLNPTGRADPATAAINSAFASLRTLRTEGLKTPEINVDWLTEPDGLEEIVVTARQMTEDELMKPFPAAQVRALFAPMKQEGLDVAASLGEGFRFAFSDWILDTEQSFGDMLRRMAVMAATSELFSLIASGLSGASGGVGKLFGKFFGGARAGGGPVEAGKSYLVGERGPEVVRFGSSGHVTPNHQLGGMVINVDARGATDPAAIEAAAHRAVLAAVQIADERTNRKLGAYMRPSMA